MGFNLGLKVLTIAHNSSSFVVKVNFYDMREFDSSAKMICKGSADFIIMGDPTKVSSIDMLPEFLSHISHLKGENAEFAAARSRVMVLLTQKNLVATDSLGIERLRITSNNMGFLCETVTPFSRERVGASGLEAVTSLKFGPIDYLPQPEPTVVVSRGEDPRVAVMAALPASASVAVTLPVAVVSQPVIAAPEVELAVSASVPVPTEVESIVTAIPGPPIVESGPRIEPPVSVLILPEERLVSQAGMFAGAAESSVKEGLTYDAKLDFIKQHNYLQWEKLNRDSLPEYCCPITLAFMLNPCIATTSGVSYERTAIEQSLLTGRSVCPSTNIALRTDQLAPNLALKAMIERYLESIDRVYRILSEAHAGENALAQISL